MIRKRCLPTSRPCSENWRGHTGVELGQFWPTRWRMENGNPGPIIEPGHFPATMPAPAAIWSRQRGRRGPVNGGKLPQALGLRIAELVIREAARGDSQAAQHRLAALASMAIAV